MNAFTFRDNLWGFVFGDDADNISIVDPIVDAIRPNMLLFAGVLVTIFIGVQVFTYMSDINSKLDPYVVIRPLLIIFAMIMYNQLVSLLIITPNLIIADIVNEGALEAQEIIKDNYDANGCNGCPNFITSGFGLACLGKKIRKCCCNNIWEGIKSRTAIGFIEDVWKLASSADSWEDFFGGIINILIKPFVQFIVWIIEQLVKFAPFFVLTKHVILSGFYYILGMFALPLSLIPGNKKIVSDWFYGFFATMMWYPMVNIILTLNSTLALVYDISDVGNELLLLVVQVTSFIMIFEVPKYTNIIVTKGAEGGKGIGSVAGGAAGAAAGGSKFVAQQAYKNRTKGSS